LLISSVPEGDTVTLEFAPGEWLLSSYIATGINNVPIFIKADNAEKEIESFLSSR
jgi:hypothetical protein